MKSYLGIDIGGTKCAVVLGCTHGNTVLITDESQKNNIGIHIIDKIKFSTDVEKGAQYTLDKISAAIDEILRLNNKTVKDISGMGISCGGPLDRKKGIVMSPPNLMGWDGIPIVDIMQKRFGIHTKLQNDANACALAEWRFGAAKGFNNAIFLTFGTGMGAGLILDGRLYSGTNDMAGEVGHIRLSENGPVGYGKSGSFEGFCSGGGIAQLARSMVLEKLQMGKKVSFCINSEDLCNLDARLVAQSAEDGDELAREVYQVSGHYLGRALSMLIDILNPEVIVIGSIYSRSEDILRNSVLEVVNRECLFDSLKVCRIVPSGLGESIGDYAALAVAI